jgi:hypothetical protein
MNRKKTNEILLRCYRQGLSLQSNFVREFDQEVAALASLRLITTKVAPHTYGRVWRITEEGLSLLRDEGYL